MTKSQQGIKNIIGSILVGLSLILLLWLGTWQLERLAWKNALIDAIETGLSKPAVELNYDGDYARFTRVIVEGVFDHESEMFLQTINPAGKPGYNVYTPLTNEQGRTIIINRGFITREMVPANTRSKEHVSGVVSVSGVLKEAAQKKYFIPENDIEGNRWFYADLNAMVDAAQLDSALVYPMFLEADYQAGQQALPRGIKPNVNIVNNHLGYAVTWYGLALSLLVVVFVFVRRQRANKG